VVRLLAKILLKCLKRRYERRTDLVVVIQSPDALVTDENRIPKDRPYWYFLPFLGPDRDKEFQPVEGEGGVKIYRLPAKKRGRGKRDGRE